ncbi:MAG: rhomboid family intramembrane serine protease [Myxococcota bacterium]|jgi:membrane associated rhomboid family serine protease|nr:rhomboid family intramembrane serine protease [Myxococcota bacterium]
MFPIRDDNQTLRKSIVTFGLIIANVVVWVLVQGLGTSPTLIESVVTLGLIPGELLGTVGAGTRVELGPSIAYVIKGSPHWFSLLSHMFMHGGWLHLIGNMWFLWVFGDNVEDAMGRFRFIVFYLLCGLTAAGAQIFSDPSSTVPMVGASGAVSGVMGAYAVLYPRAGVHVLVLLGFIPLRFVVPAFLMLVYWFLLQLLSTSFDQGGGVAFWAHIGGFIAGVVLVFFFRDEEIVKQQRELMRWNRWKHQRGERPSSS